VPRRPNAGPLPSWTPRSVVAAAAILAAIGSSPGTPAGASTKHVGTAEVLYAASLQQIMETSIGPAFERATGYKFAGFPGASGALANEIKGGVVRSDVFVSANEATNLTLEGSSNGSWLTAFVVFGNSPLVLGYSRSSSYAAIIRRTPWFASVTQPGIRVGRTDPSVDPKGKLTVQAIAAGVQIYNDPALASITASPTNIYPEQALVGLLQSGQLDAGFFYASEAKAAGIPSIKLGRLNLAATYTVANLAHGPDQAAGAAFTTFLLGPIGHRLLSREGVTVVHPKVVGPPSGLPRSVRVVVHSSV
jgi:molybdate/tungstate transport system substrate-binding protein